MPPRRPRRTAPEGPGFFEAEVVPGLEPFAAAELNSALHLSVGDVALTPTLSQRERGSTIGSIPFAYSGPWPKLLHLRTVTAVHAVVGAGLPRPTALLDDGLFRRIAATIGHIRSLHPSGAFSTFRLGGAGVDSPAFRRFAERIRLETGLEETHDGGDLLLRFKRATAQGFELTARLSRRPLSARPWRVCDLPGALNATVAATMATLTEPRPDDCYLNLGCGSGTLLIERASLAPASKLIGCDLDPDALSCGGRNISAAGVPAVLHAWDATTTPLPDASVSALVADLPFGQLVGSHQDNTRLYPAILAEAARLARPAARFVAITQQVNLFERCLRDARRWWELGRTVRIQIPSNAGPLHPRIYVLRRIS